MIEIESFLNREGCKLLDDSCLEQFNQIFQGFTFSDEEMVKIRTLNLTQSDIQSWVCNGSSNKALKGNCKGIKKPTESFALKSRSTAQSSYGCNRKFVLRQDGGDCFSGEHSEACCSNPISEACCS